MNVLNMLSLKEVFAFFEELTSIPRASGNEKQVSNYLVDFAKKRGLEVFQDEALNVIIKKDGTKGYENSAPVIIQGHMDIVGEKTSGSKHDFSKDPLELRIVDDFIYATATTLGGDDGIAIAYGLAILDSKNLKHPPIELLITTNEETGMNGASALTAEHLSGKTMLNIDSEEEGVFLVSCAGGLTSYVTFNPKYEDLSGEVMVEIKKASGDKMMLSNSSNNIIKYILTVPDGIQGMSSDIKGLVESSLNLGVLEQKGDKIEFTHSVRSSVKSRRTEIAEIISALGDLTGAVVKNTGDYPEWQYEEDSKIRKIAMETYKSLFKKEPEISAIHAGLECGLLKKILPETDMISFGPNLFDVHTPEEHMSISSAERTYKFLIALLENLK